MLPISIEFVAWLLEQTLSQSVEFADTTHLCAILLFNAVIIATPGQKDLAYFEPLKAHPSNIFRHDPYAARAVWYFLTGEDTAGVWMKQKFSSAWRLDAVTGSNIPKERLRSLLDARITAFNTANPMRVCASAPAPRVEPEGSAHPLARKAVAVVSASVQVLPVATAPAVAPPSQAERMEELGELLYPLVAIELPQFSTDITAGKIVGMLLDAGKDEENELRAILGDRSLLLSYIGECIHACSTPAPPAVLFTGPTPAEALAIRRAAQAEATQARRDAVAVHSTLNAVAKKLEPFAAADALAGSLAVFLSAQSGVVLSHEDLVSVALETARKVLGLSIPSTLI